MIRPPPRSPLFPYPTLSRSVAGEHAPGPVPAVRGRREADHDDARLHIPEAWDGPPPVVLAAERRTSGDRRSESHQPRAFLAGEDRKSTRLNSSHSQISYAVF